MDAKITGSKAQHFSGAVVRDAGAQQKSSEWNSNDWNWDGDLFRATPLGSAQLDWRSRQFFPVTNPACASSDSMGGESSRLEISDPNCGNENREAEKRRRDGLIDDEELREGAGCLGLKLGGQVYPIADGDSKGGKKTKCEVPISSGVVCQVEGCNTDLSNLKEYHRRHKVCQMHSKAGEALVGNLVQRFCQQCSKFHLLEEFDEGKRSCRRRLAGHNKRRRRRKPNPDSVADGISPYSERESKYILMGLLGLLAKMQSDSSDQTILSHMMSNLVGSSGELMLGLLEEAKNAPPSNGPESSKAGCSNSQEPVRCTELNTGRAPSSHVVLNTTAVGISAENSSKLKSAVQFPSREFHLQQQNEIGPAVGKGILNNFDLNMVYEEDGTQNLDDRYPGAPLIEGKDYQRVSPAPNSSPSNATFSQSTSSSDGEPQSLTDRIVLKLFDKGPISVPHNMREQLLNWLSRSPADIESHIRPGCIILTVYIHLEKSMWEELCGKLGSKLRRLLEGSTDSFWKTGWLFMRIQNSVAFAYNGRIVLDTTLPMRNHENIKIASIKPIAVSVSERVEFLVKGFNLLQSASRLLCMLEGKCLAQRSCYEVAEGERLIEDSNELQCLILRCSMPGVRGRGYVEVEDCSFNSSFFPFIVAEEEVCSEIRSLETVIDAIDEDDERAGARNHALEFIHEIGWLLRRSHLKQKLKDLGREFKCFPLERFKWLVEFAIEKDWCAVVKLLLGILFDGVVGCEEHHTMDKVLLDMSLLHRAVQRNCRAMVEFLLCYVPSEGSCSESKSKANQLHDRYIFKPDASGPGGLTPLHIAASTAGSELVLDALTNDPASIGLMAWKTARDDTGLTPYDYASLRRHYTYTYLVQRKINGESNNGQIIVDIPTFPSSSSYKGKKASSFQTEERKSFELQDWSGQCKLCKESSIHYRNLVSTSLLYHPTVLSMVAIATVCVCVALMFKSSPEVFPGVRPFTWERLKYGSI